MPTGTLIPGMGTIGAGGRVVGAAVDRLGVLLAATMGHGVAGGAAADRESAAPVVFAGSAGLCHNAVLWPADAAGLRTGSGVPQAVVVGGLFSFRTGSNCPAQDGDHLPDDLRAVAWVGSVAR